MSLWRIPQDGRPGSLRISSGMADCSTQAGAGWRGTHIRPPSCHVPILPVFCPNPNLQGGSQGRGGPLRSHSPNGEREKGNFGSLGLNPGKVSWTCQSLHIGPESWVISSLLGNSGQGTGISCPSVTGGGSKHFTPSYSITLSCAWTSTGSVGSAAAEGLVELVHLEESGSEQDAPKELAMRLAGRGN